MGRPQINKNIPLWRVTFGDMMALLLLFFILLLSTSKVDMVKFKDAAGSLKDAFGIRSGKAVGEAVTTDQSGSTAFSREIILIHVVEKLHMLLSLRVESGEAEIIENDKGFTVRMSSDKIFNRDTLALTKDAIDVLQPLANLLSGIPNIIYVNGYTDNVPANPNGAYPSNWAISAVQAATVVNFFATKGGIEAARLQVRANGEFSPLMSNENDDGRTKNRRLEIFVSRENPPTPPKESATNKGSK